MTDIVESLFDIAFRTSRESMKRILLDACEEIGRLRLGNSLLEQRMAELESKIKSTELNLEWGKCRYCRAEIKSNYEKEETHWIERHDDDCRMFSPDGRVK